MLSLLLAEHFQYFVHNNIWTGSQLRWFSLQFIKKKRAFFTLFVIAIHKTMSYSILFIIVINIRVTYFTIFITVVLKKISYFTVSIIVIHKKVMYTTLLLITKTLPWEVLTGSSDKMLWRVSTWSSLLCLSTSITMILMRTCP